MRARSTQDAVPDTDSDPVRRRRGREAKGQTNEQLMLYINFPSAVLNGHSHCLQKTLSFHWVHFCNAPIV